MTLEKRIPFLVVVGLPSVFAEPFTPSTRPTASPNEVRDAEYYYALMWTPC